MITDIVSPGAVGITLRRYIERSWPMIPGHEIDRLFSARDVKLDGTRAAHDQMLRGGEALCIYLPDRFLPSPLPVLYDDGNILAVDKPQRLPVDTDSDGIGRDTALSRVRSVYPGAVLCHRLDSVTGGLLLFALDDIHAGAMETVFREHLIRKTYIAVVKGPMGSVSGKMTDRLIVDKSSSFVRISREKDKGLYAETEWKLLQNGDKALLELNPVTGRTHQLRVQLASRRHPILMDDKYGDRQFNRTSNGPVRLWCRSVRFGTELPDPLQYLKNVRIVSGGPDWKEAAK